MWMDRPGYGNYESEFDMSSAGSLHGRKLRPLMPRPTTANFSPIPNPNSSNCTRVHKAYHSTMSGRNLATIKNQGKLDSSTPAVACSRLTKRWSPTPEQLHALKEMYRRGIRTPTTEQIHLIAAKLRLLGKIEGKNVFYWFQNHKARERQRLRRMAICTPCDQEEQTQRHDHMQTHERRRNPGLSSTGFEIGTTKDQAASSNWSTVSEDSVSILRTAVSEKGTDGWIDQFDMEKKLQQTTKGSTETMQTNWKLIMKPHFKFTPPNILLIPTANSSKTTQEAASGIDEFEGEMRDNHTLQLFPIQSGDILQGPSHEH